MYDVNISARNSIKLSFRQQLSCPESYRKAITLISGEFSVKLASDDPQEQGLTL
jgi:hypothetical protein